VEDLAWRVLVKIVTPSVGAWGVTVAVTIGEVSVQLVLRANLPRWAWERHFRVL
jgi:hypothetical protein